MSLGSCLTCGSARVQAVVEEVVLRIRGRVRRFPSVAHEKCLKCGERIFDLDTSKRFDHALLARKRAVRAA